MPENIVLRLTPEELYLLQSALGIDELPGFDSDLLAKLDDVQREQALATADHTLRARGLVGWDETRHRMVNPTLAALLLDYAHPRYTLFVDTYIASTRVAPFLYIFGSPDNIGGQAIYEQCEPEPDVLQLRILASYEELEQRLYPKLPQEQRGAAYLQGRIVQRELNAGVKVARENPTLAQQIFSISLESPAATELAIAYHEPQVVQYMARWKQTPTMDHPTPNVALTILQGPKRSYLLWVEEPSPGEMAMVMVQRASAELLQSYLTRLLPPRPTNNENARGFGRD